MSKIEKYKKFLRNRTKGWIGEELFAELLRINDYKVIRFGIENNFYILKELIKNDVSNTAIQLRHMPDYIVIKNDNTWMIEIKTTRFKEKILIDEEEYESLVKYWPETLLVVISYNDPPYIRYEHIYNIERMLSDKRDTRIRKKYMRKYHGNKVVINLNVLKPINFIYKEVSSEEIKSAVELLEKLDNIL